MYRYAKLRGKIIEKYGNQRNFSEEINLSRASLSKKMTGKSRFDQKDIELWSKKLDISKDDIGKYFFA